MRNLVAIALLTLCLAANAFAGGAVSGASAAVQTGDAAGGDLTGTYPNPTVAANSVALGTDTTGNYVASVGGCGAAEGTVCTGRLVFITSVVADTSDPGAAATACSAHTGATGVSVNFATICMPNASPTDADCAYSHCYPSNADEVTICWSSVDSVSGCTTPSTTYYIMQAQPG